MNNSRNLWPIILLLIAMGSGCNAQEIEADDNSVVSSAGISNGQQEVEATFKADAEEVMKSAFDPMGRERFMRLAQRRSSDWKQGSEEGIPTAQFLWALCNYQGIGTTRNPVKANKLIEQAATQGSPYALVEIAKSAEAAGNPACIKVYELAVEQAFAWAEYRLGVVYAEGKVTKQDQQKAFHLILAAAEKDLVAAQTDVGSRFERGIGTTKSLQKAFYWYSKAAEQEDPVGHLNAGVCYLRQIGTPGDISKAKHHLQIAERMGQTLASDYLNFIRKAEMAIAESSVPSIPQFDPKDPNNIYNMTPDSQYRELEYRRRENAISNRY